MTGKAILKSSIRIGIPILCFLFLLDAYLLVGLAQFLWALLGGWFFAALRLAGGVHSWDSVLLWLGLFALLTLGLHFFVRQLPTEWSFRKTLSATGICWLSLFAGMCVVGIVHQIGWLAATHEPVFVGNRRLILRLTSGQVAKAAKENRWTIPEVQKATEYYGERVETIILQNAEEKIDRVLIAGREGQTDFVEVHADGTRIWKPISDLRRAVQR